MTDLQKLRTALRGKVREDGVCLVYKSRYEASAQNVADLVKLLGGSVWSLSKTGKMTKNRPNTWTVVFDVNTEADLYLAGRITMARFLELQKDKT